TGHSRDECHFRLQAPQTLVLHREHRPCSRPRSRVMFSGWIKAPHLFEGQWRRLRVECSINLRSQVFLKFMSNKWLTCVSGMFSSQHCGGICCSSVTDSLKLRFKHELHMRWPQSSFAVFRDGNSSKHTTHF